MARYKPFCRARNACSSRLQQEPAKQSSHFKFAGSSRIRDGTAPVSIVVRASFIWQIAISSSTTRRIRFSRPSARHKIEGEAIKSREMYFATYQALAKDERRPGLYRECPRDFFDLIIVDECHRGSARDESNWREILEYFEPAFQLGMTATPLREDNRDTYRYFRNPLYIYSLRQGIDDGFLAPYRVQHRFDGRCSRMAADAGRS
jgi:hypothetical protein